MKKKKSLIALLLIAIIGVVGGTFAYFTSNDTFVAGTYNIDINS